MDTSVVSQKRLDNGLQSQRIFRMKISNVLFANLFVRHPTRWYELVME